MFTINLEDEREAPSKASNLKNKYNHLIKNSIFAAFDPLSENKEYDIL